MDQRQAVRIVAVLEALKGLIVLAAATGVLALIHRNLHEIAARLIEHLHLNPASKYPRIFVDAAGRLQDSHLLLLAVGALCYSLVRFVEAYGLFYERSWAEIFSAASGGVYVPIEVAHLIQHPSWLGVSILAVNIAVVAVMLRALWLRRRTAASQS